MESQVKLGRFEIMALVDEDCFEIDLARIFPTADPAALALLSWLDPFHYAPESGKVRLGMHSFLVRTGTLNILVDMCIGTQKNRPGHPAWHQRTDTGLLTRLARAGLAPEDIDLVFCTHLHADHVGWNTRLVDGRWVPTFPNARYAMGKNELAFWQGAHENEGSEANHGAYADSVLPVVASGLALVVEPCDSLFAGMRFVDLSGHTPGHLGMEIASDGRAALFCGDAIHSPLQLHFPDVSSAFCDDPVASARTRRNMLEDVAERGTILCPAHFRGRRTVRIGRDGERFSLLD